MQIRSRLAPTPSGLLHPGNGISFLLTWALTRAWEGFLALRIDDLDEARSRYNYLEDIFRTLDWLGIDYDEGPTGPDDLLDNFSQQHRLSGYLEVVQILRQKGVLFACTCSRKDIRTAGTGGIYPGTCRDLGLPFEAEATSWRAGVEASARLEQPAWPDKKLLLDPGKSMGDFVVKRKNGMPSYQVSSLLDDIDMGSNFIVRGEDLLPSTAAQRFLAEALGYSSFGKIVFYHHALVKDGQGGKLSKSKGADSLQAWRESGRGPEELVQEAAQWLQVSLPEGSGANDLKEAIKASLPKPKAFEYL